MSIYDEVRAERERAHAVHGPTSMESQPADAMRRFFILAEEVGEVAKEFNDADHEQRPVDMGKLRKELIQVAAMAAGWADAILPRDDVGRCFDCGQPSQSPVCNACYER